MVSFSPSFHTSSLAENLQNERGVGRPRAKIDITEAFVDMIQATNKIGENEVYDEKTLLSKTLDARGIQRYLEAIGHETIACDNHLMASILRRLDRDKDGLISIEDYVKAMSALQISKNYSVELAQRMM